MKAMLFVMTFFLFIAMAYASHAAESASRAPVEALRLASNAAIDLPREAVVGDRYLVPNLPPGVVDQLPVAARGEQYLPQRIELAELVVGERILVAEDLATIYARDLPGFAEVLVSDGFRQDPDGAWYYDRFESWMRFPLNR